MVAQFEGATAAAERPHIVVLGAGVIGLTSAHVLQRRGYKVTVVARDLPEDTHSSAFASPWAGANWCSFASSSNFEQQRYDQVTFETWTELARHLPSDVMATIPFLQNKVRDVPWFKFVVPDFRLEKHEAEESFLKASYQSHCIHVPRYTEWLVSELTNPTSTIVPASPFLDDLELSDVPLAGTHACPVRFERIDGVTSLADVSAHFPDAALIVNASGLGAARLTDVRDGTVYPVAGQVVVVRAPRNRVLPRCVMGVLEDHSEPAADALSSGDESDSGSAPETTVDEKRFRKDPVAYVIPRAKSGEVILGGSYDEGSFDTRVNPALSETIRQNAVRLCPDLLLRAPEDYRRADGSAMTTEEREEQERTELEEIRADPEAWRRLHVLSEHVGLRPARKNGIRIAQDSIASPATATNTMRVVHAYGVGPAGYQSSWGVAHEVALQVKKSLSRSPTFRLGDADLIALSGSPSCSSSSLPPSPSEAFTRLASSTAAHAPATSQEGLGHHLSTAATAADATALQLEDSDAATLVSTSSSSGDAPTLAHPHPPAAAAGKGSLGADCQSPLRQLVGLAAA